jgi:YVTN family beta-propeller protein
MPRFRWLLGALVFGLAGALVGVVPDGVSVVEARGPCRATAFVANLVGGTVSAIDVKTRTKYPTDIPIGQAKTAGAVMPPGPIGVAITPDGKTAFVTDGGSGRVATIDVKTRKKHPTDIPVGSLPFWVAFTPDGKTAFVTNNGSGTVSTIDVKTRKKHPTDIPVDGYPKGLAITPDGKTAFVTHGNYDNDPGIVDELTGTVSTIDVKTRTKHPTHIPVGAPNYRVAITPDGTTAFVQGIPMSVIDVKTRAKTADIPQGGGELAFTPDGKTAYFASSDEFFPFTRQATIYVSHLADGAWTAPEVAPFSGRYSDIDPFLSPDGRRLYFSSIRPVEGVTRGDLDIWMVERTVNGWGDPVRLGPEVNSTEDELYASTSARGTLYFASGPPFPQPGKHFDIYSAAREEDGFARRTRGPY